MIYLSPKGADLRLQLDDEEICYWLRPDESVISLTVSNSGAELFVMSRAEAFRYAQKERSTHQVVASSDAWVELEQEMNA